MKTMSGDQLAVIANWRQIAFVSPFATYSIRCESSITKVLSSSVLDKCSFKMLEHIVCTIIMDHIYEHKLLSDRQHVFRKNELIHFCAIGNKGL